MHAADEAIEAAVQLGAIPAVVPLLTLGDLAASPSPE
jgi:hypothetical protein